MPELHLTSLNRPDVERLALTDDEILGAVEGGLRAQGLGETVIEPRVACHQRVAYHGASLSSRSRVPDAVQRETLRCIRGTAPISFLGKRPRCRDA